MASARALLDSLSGQAQPRSARALLASLQQPRPAAAERGRFDHVLEAVGNSFQGAGFRAARTLMGYDQLIDQAGDAVSGFIDKLPPNRQVQPYEAGGQATIGATPRYQSPDLNRAVLTGESPQEYAPLPPQQPMQEDALNYAGYGERRLPIVPEVARTNPTLEQRYPTIGEQIAGVPLGLAQGALRTVTGEGFPNQNPQQGSFVKDALSSPAAQVSDVVGQLGGYIGGSMALGTLGGAGRIAQAATRGEQVANAGANVLRNVAGDAIIGGGFEASRQAVQGQFDPVALADQAILSPTLFAPVNVGLGLKGALQETSEQAAQRLNQAARLRQAEAGGGTPIARPDAQRPPIDIPPVAAPTDDVAAATKHVDNVIQNNMTPTQRASMTPEARQKMIDQKVSAIKRGRSMRAFESTPEGKAKAEQDRLAGIEREKQRTIQAEKDEAAQTEWKSKGNTKRQISTIEKKLQSSGIEFRTNWNADKNSAYVKFVSPVDGETYTVRVSDHKQPEFGGFRQNDEGTGSRGFAADLSIDPISGNTVADIDGLLTKPPIAPEPVAPQGAEKLPVENELSEKIPLPPDQSPDVGKMVEKPTIGESAFSKVQHSEIPKSFQVEIDVPSAKTGKIRKVKANAREAYENAGKMADQHKALLACLRGK